MYFLDRLREQDGRRIYKTKAGFRKPVQRDRQGRYKIQSGEMLRVCMTSDFFWRKPTAGGRSLGHDAGAERCGVYLLTKRPERVERCLPRDWGRMAQYFSSSDLRKSAPGGRAHPHPAGTALSPQGDHVRALFRPGEHPALSGIRANRAGKMRRGRITTAPVPAILIGSRRSGRECRLPCDFLLH